MLATWELPGPSGFVNKAGQDLSDGCSVIFALGEIHPEGLHGRLDSVLSDYGLRMVDIHIPEWNEREFFTPEQVLSELFSLEVKGRDIFSKILAMSPQFTDERHVVWIDGISENEWPKWKLFLDEYEHASRGVEVWHRTVFAVQLVGGVARNLPKNKPAVALKIHRFYHGVVNRIDTLLYVTSRLDNAAETPNHYRLLLNMVVELAGTDLGLAERFCREDIFTVSTPFPILKNLALERGWDKITSSPASVISGTTDLFDGQEYVNSAYLAICGQEQEIVRRLWRAQLSVIFPMIEEKRLRYIGKMRGQFPLPFKTSYGDVTVEDELEISHLCFMARTNKISVDRSTFRVLDKLREMRNALAHLEAVPHEFLNDTQLFRPGI